MQHGVTYSASFQFLLFHTPLTDFLFRMRIVITAVPERFHSGTADGGYGDLISLYSIISMISKSSMMTEFSSAYRAIGL